MFFIMNFWEIELGFRFLEDSHVLLMNIFPCIFILYTFSDNSGRTWLDFMSLHVGLPYSVQYT